MDIGGAVVLITGGGRGIGSALAKSFSESGAKVAIVSRTEEEIDGIEETAEETEGFSVAGDVRDEDDCERIVKEVMDHYGRIDILINNAGVALNKPLTEHTPMEYDTIMDTNVRGVFLMTKEVAPLRPKIIITVSSGAGKTGYPGLSIYCASKFAIRGMMESFAQETHSKVYTVLPGGTDTKMYQELFEERARVKPEQVANAIVALCQEEPTTGFELELYNHL